MKPTSLKTPFNLKPTSLKTPFNLKPTDLKGMYFQNHSKHTSVLSTRGVKPLTRSTCTSIRPLPRVDLILFLFHRPRALRVILLHELLEAHDVDTDLLLLLRDVVAQAQNKKQRFKLKAMLRILFSNRTLKTGGCFQAEVSLHLRPL